MLSSSVDKRGLKVADRGNEALSTDVVKLLKTQDAAYIRTVLQQVRRERARLEEKLVLEEAGEVKTVRDGEESRQRVHRVFVGDEGEQEEFDADAWFGQGKSMPTASTPEVPRETKAAPGWMAPRPTAPAALSPAPAAMIGGRVMDQRVVDHYDGDVKDGKISSGELAKLLGDAGVGNWLTRSTWASGIIAELDTDKDGSISEAEFEDVLK